MDATIRDARREDCGAMTAIYNHYVRTSTCTFALEDEPLAERQRWFDAHGPRHPIVVAEERGEVIGWASLSSWNPRGAYARTVESSIYLRDDRRGRGLGRLLLADLVARAAALGHHTVLAGVSADQDASLALHRALGFVEVARMRELGWKFDRWIDVVFLQRML